MTLHRGQKADIRHLEGPPLVLEDGLGVRVESEEEARGVLAVPHGLELLVRHVDSGGWDFDCRASSKD